MRSIISYFSYFHHRSSIYSESCISDTNVGLKGHPIPFAIEEPSRGTEEDSPSSISLCIPPCDDRSRRFDCRKISFQIPFRVKYIRGTRIHHVSTYNTTSLISSLPWNGTHFEHAMLSLLSMPVVLFEYSSHAASTNTRKY